MSINIPEHLARGHGVAKDGKSFSESAREIGANWANRFETYGGLTGSASILDIGCGPGRTALAIGERFGWTNRYYGFDIKTADIDFAQDFITTKHKNFEFSKLDIRSRFTILMEPSSLSRRNFHVKMKASTSALLHRFLPISMRAQWHFTLVRQRDDLPSK